MALPLPRHLPVSILTLALAGSVACGDDAPVDRHDADAGFLGEPVPPLPDDAGPDDAAGEADAATPADANVDDPSTRAPEPGFITQVESFEPGQCAGFGASQMPGVVFGGPRGAGELAGGTDVVSLGTGGSIVLGFAPHSIVDGEGADFIVFENAFWANGNASRPYAELAQVSVSEDGEEWHEFPCDPAATGADRGQCAGWRPVYAHPSNGIDPTTPEAGGDPFDLATIGVARAHFVRIVDMGSLACTGSATSNGFDLDAIAVVHGAP